MAEPLLAPEARVRLVAALAVVVAAFECLHFLDPDFVIDDAFITFRVARSWAVTGIPTFDVAFPPVESSTTPLWTFLVALGLKVFPGTNPLGAARAVGMLCHLATLGIALRLVTRLARAQGGSPLRAAIWAAVAFNAGSWLAFHDVSGMETSLYGLLFMAAAERLEAFHRQVGGPVTLMAGLLLGLLGACRPEGVLVAMLACGAIAVSPAHRSKLAWVAVPSGAIILGVEGWRWATYHAWVPNTLQAKPPSLIDGLIYLGSFLLQGAGLFGPLAALPLLRRSPYARAMLGVLLVLAAGLAWSGGDWMPGFRRLSLLSLGAVILASAGAGVAEGRQRLGVWAALVAWAAGNGVLVMRGKDSQPYDTVGMADLGRKARQSGLHQVALSDIGAFGWSFEGSIYDLYGLTDRRIASAPGPHGSKALDLDYFRQRNPEAVILRSFAKQLASPEDLHWVVNNEKDLARYVLASSDYVLRERIPYAAGYLFVFARHGLELPSAIWGGSAVELSGR